MREDGLADDEGCVMDALCDAVEAWDALERQHPNEDAEFYAAIHRLQDMLAVRVCRRDYPKGWVTYAGDN